MPDLEHGSDLDVALEALRGNLQGSVLNRVYIYPIPPAQVNCSGNISTIQFCYRSDRRLTTEQHIFTLLALDQTGLNFRITKIIDVQSTPFDPICTPVRFTIYEFCCDILVLDTFDHFQLPTAFGIVILDPAVINLLGFGVEDYTQYQVEDLFLTTQEAIGNITTGRTFTLTNDSRIINQTLRILEFTISE